VVGRDLLGGQVAMVVVDGHFGRVLMVERSGGIGLQKEILGQELSVHSTPRFD
jgi:fatty acid/phospholipid biosynthesis enzyme